MWGARVRELLAGRNYGLFVAQVLEVLRAALVTSLQVERMYEKKWSCCLPQGWVEDMEEGGGMEVEREGGKGANPVCTLAKDGKTAVRGSSAVTQGVDWVVVGGRVESLLRCIQCAAKKHSWLVCQVAVCHLTH